MVSRRPGQTYAFQPSEKVCTTGLVRAVLNARSSEGPGTLGPGDIGLVFDGGKQGNKNKFLIGKKAQSKKERKIKQKMTMKVMKGRKEMKTKKMAMTSPIWCATSSSSPTQKKA